MRKNTLQIGNYALLTRISKQLPYPSPHHIRLICSSLSFVPWVINWKSNCATSYWKKDWTTAVPNIQIFTCHCLRCYLNATEILVKKTETQNSQSSSLLAWLSLSATFYYLYFNSLMSLYDLKFERSIQLTVLCQSLKQTVQASLQAICCAVSGCYLQVFQGIT